MRTATLTKLLSVSVTKEMFEQVKSIADSDNISVGQMVRCILDYALEHQYAWRKVDENNSGKRNCFRFNLSDGDVFQLSNKDLEKGGK